MVLHSDDSCHTSQLPHVFFIIIYIIMYRPRDCGTGNFTPVWEKNRPEGIDTLTARVVRRCNTSKKDDSYFLLCPLAATLSHRTKEKTVCSVLTVTVSVLTAAWVCCLPDTECTHPPFVWVLNTVSLCMPLVEGANQVIHTYSLTGADRIYTYI